MTTDATGCDTLAKLFRKGFSVCHPELTFTIPDQVEA